MSAKTEIQEKTKRTLSILVLLTATSMLFLYNWITDSIAQAHVMPEQSKYDLREVPWLTMGRDELLELLAGQTGLCETTVLQMLEENRGAELIRLQEIYFAPAETESLQTTPLTVSEWLVGADGNICKGMPLVDIRNGDILITKNSRFLGWRNGHVGLVVDAEKGLVLEALTIGSPSKLCKISKWEKYPSFQVLRLREEYAWEDGATQVPGVETAETDWLPEQIADYASENLVDIPYHLLADVLKSPKADELAVPTGTHCAHLVWYAYKQFGIDLDSDGGIIVTPEDIRNSPYLEVVQSYGY